MQRSMPRAYFKIITGEESIIVNLTYHLHSTRQSLRQLMNAHRIHPLDLYGRMASAVMKEENKVTVEIYEYFPEIRLHQLVRTVEMEATKSDEKPPETPIQTCPPQKDFIFP